MTGRLSHELRTPMTIVKSSLDRMEKESREDEKKEALNRAKQGLDRLQNLLNRLSEAASIEQALQEGDKQSIILNAFLEQCIDGYRNAFPNQEFDLNTPSDDFEMNIDGELFSQMLDKIISNAVNFSHPDKPILINLIHNLDHATIEIINYGSPLPQNMTDELFNSMVSIPGNRTDAGPHLGLGLFIARLIAEFHGGVISASNLQDQKGVCFSIKI